MLLVCRVVTVHIEQLISDIVRFVIIVAYLPKDCREVARILTGTEAFFVLHISFNAIRFKGKFKIN